MSWYALKKFFFLFSIIAVRILCSFISYSISCFVFLYIKLVLVYSYPQQSLFLIAFCHSSITFSFHIRVITDSKQMLQRTVFFFFCLLPLTVNGLFTCNCLFLKNASLATVIPLLISV